MQINPIALANDGVRKVFEVFEAHQPDSVRVVGGTVRDAIMGRAINDIDFATPITPDVVTDIFTKAGFNVVPTGIDHGTISVIWNHEPFEITTLRRDVETDGRRAVVAFSTDWEEDAYRRDFRFNALYMDRDGNIHDYSLDNGGINDAVYRQITFMGNASDRIREDYLRILRMFRFQSVLNGYVDGEALEAAATHRGGISTLSGERLEKEALKLLAGENFKGALKDMAATGVFEYVFGISDAEVGNAIKRIEIAGREMNRQFAVPLASMFAWDADALETLLKRWKSSNTMRAHVLEPMQMGPIDLTTITDHQVRVAAYSSVVATIVRLGLSWVTDQAVSEARVRELIALAEANTFPIQGRDVLAMGVSPGKMIGEILKTVEDRWIAADFPSEDVVRQMLDEEVSRLASV